MQGLENASRASELLKKDAASRRRWKLLAADLRANLPVDAETGGYRYADDRTVPTETAHLGMIFPFSFDVFGQRSRRTLESALAVFRCTWEGKTSDQVFSYNWIWAIGRLAAACFYQGRGDDGYEVLGRAQASVGPFMAPCEHYREKDGAFLPWFGTGAGAYVYAMNAMFVQFFDEGGAILLPAVPSALREARFHDLLATHGVRVSGSISKGKVDSLSAHSEKTLRWGFRVPAAAARNLRFSSAVSRKGTDPHGFLRLVCQLKRGTTRLAAGR